MILDFMVYVMKNPNSFSLQKTLLITIFLTLKNFKDERKY